MCSKILNIFESFTVLIYIYLFLKCIVKFIWQVYSVICHLLSRFTMKFDYLFGRFTMKFDHLFGRFTVLFDHTVKNAVKLLGAPSRNSVLMLKKYNITDEIFWLSSHVFFFLPC